MFYRVVGSFILYCRLVFRVRVGGLELSVGGGLVFEEFEVIRGFGFEILGSNVGGRFFWG